MTKRLSMASAEGVPAIYAIDLFPLTPSMAATRFTHNLI